MSDMKANWSVAIIYENPQAREAAVAFCDALVRKFWATHDFDLNWIPFELLEDRESAKLSASKAAKADLLLFAMGMDRGVPLHIGCWNESWVAHRADREGVLIG